MSFGGEDVTINNEIQEFLERDIRDIHEKLGKTKLKIMETKTKCDFFFVCLFCRQRTTGRIKVPDNKCVDGYSISP